MKATTCNCNDKGFVHVTLYPGITEVIPCNCRPPEYFAERSRRRREEFEIRLAIAINQLEGLNHGEEIESAGS